MSASVLVGLSEPHPVHVQEVVGAPRVSDLGFGSRMRDTEEGRARQEQEINRLRAWCERNGVPFPSVTGAECHGGTAEILNPDQQHDEAAGDPAEPEPRP